MEFDPTKRVRPYTEDLPLAKRPCIELHNLPSLMQLMSDLIICIFQKIKCYQNLRETCIAFKAIIDTNPCFSIKIFGFQLLKNIRIQNQGFFELNRINSTAAKAYIWDNPNLSLKLVNELNLDFKFDSILEISANFIKSNNINEAHNWGCLSLNTLKCISDDDRWDLKPLIEASSKIALQIILSYCNKSIDDSRLDIENSKFIIDDPQDSFANVIILFGEKYPEEILSFYKKLHDENTLLDAEKYYTSVNTLLSIHFARD
jgi:hypothetical protein